MWDFEQQKDDLNERERVITQPVRENLTKGTFVSRDRVSRVDAEDFYVSSVAVLSSDQDHF